MNNASLGMPPASVVEAVCRGYRAISEEPLHGKHELQVQISDHVMPRLAAFLGVSDDEVGLTRNATEALQLAALGAVLEPGQEVLMTTQEHPAGRRPWELRAAREGVRIREVFIPSPFDSPERVLELVEDALTPETGVLAFCHVTRGGHLYPVADLCTLARARGIISHVDGAQAIGMFPIDLRELGCDTYSVSLHKWLLGPAGTGALYVRRDTRERIASSFAESSVGEVPEYAPGGTADLPVRAGLTAALDFAEALGPELVARRTRYLSDYLKERLLTLPGVRILSGPTPATSCPASTIFEMDGVDALAAVPAIEELASTHIDEHQRDGHNAIRISTHVYNTRMEIDRVVAALQSLPG